MKKVTRKARRARRSAHVLLVGRDPAKGRSAFKTGAIETGKDKLRRRNSKKAQQHVRCELSDSG